MRQDQKQERIQELKRQIIALKGQLPKHSIPPAMLQKLEELEDELEQLLSTGEDKKA